MSIDSLIEIHIGGQSSSVLTVVILQAIKEVYIKLSSEIDASMLKLKMLLADELMKLQNKRLTRGEQDEQSTRHDSFGIHPFDKHEGVGHEYEKAEEEKEDSDEDGQHNLEKDKDEVGEDEHGSEDEKGQQPAHDNEEQQGRKEDENDDVRRKGKRLKLPTRRSDRPKTAAVKTPFTATYVRKGKLSAKENLYMLCCEGCSEEEGKEILVDMFHHHATRLDLQVFGPRRWISNRIMTLVAHTLNGEEKEKPSGVARHIFDADFMAKIVRDETRWEPHNHLSQILPQHLGYNLAECHFLFGPTLIDAHWICYVIEPSTMKFYVLDSMRGGEEGNNDSKGKGKRKKKDPKAERMQMVAELVRSKFTEILRTVKPDIESLTEPHGDSAMMHPRVPIQHNK